jgi:hypothetical protein
MESPSHGEPVEKSEQPNARKIDLRNIPEALEILKKELAWQQAMEQAATPGPWMDSVTHINSAMDKDLDVVCECCGVNPTANVEVVCLSRNLNPARLRVAKRLLDEYEAPWHIELAAALLGVEVTI